MVGLADLEAVQNSSICNLWSKPKNFQENQWEGILLANVYPEGVPKIKGILILN